MNNYTKPERHYRDADCTFFTAVSLPRASAVKMPSAAKAAQTSRAVWKLLTNEFCSQLMLVSGRLCACGDVRRQPPVGPPKSPKPVPVGTALMLDPMRNPVPRKLDT